MIGQCTPIERHVGETLCTLAFSQRCQMVELGPAKRKVETAPQSASKPASQSILKPPSQSPQKPPSNIPSHKPEGRREVADNPLSPRLMPGAAQKQTDARREGNPLSPRMSAIPALRQTSEPRRDANPLSPRATGIPYMSADKRKSLPSALI